MKSLRAIYARSGTRIRYRFGCIHPSQTVCHTFGHQYVDLSSAPIHLYLSCTSGPDFFTCSPYIQVVRTLWLPCYAGATEQVQLTQPQVQVRGWLSIQPHLSSYAPYPIHPSMMPQVILLRAALFSLHWTLAALVSSKETRRSVQ